MLFLHHIWRFLGGLFLVNALPHLCNGVCGRAFQSPFATPPGVGLSSPLVNVYWGCFNLAVAYVLVYKTSKFDIRLTAHAASVLAGIFAGAVVCAHFFGPIYTLG